MADPIGTPLAALATAEQCIRLAAKLRQKYNDYITAEHSLRELCLVLEYRAVTIENQVVFLRSVWSTLESRLQNLQNTLLHMLYHKLSYAIDLVDAAIGTKQESPSLKSILSKRGSIRKFYFAFSLKQCLQKTVDDLDKWHKMFDPTWYLICRIPGAVVDESLQRHAEAKSVSILKDLRSAASGWSQATQEKPPKLLDAEILTDAKSSADLGFGIQWFRLRSGDSVIVNRFTPHKNASPKRTRDEIDRLSSILANVDPEIFGLLRCHGVILHEHSASSLKQTDYDILLTVPSGMTKPCSLRSKLTDTPSVSLNVRLSLAQSLSNAVMFVHSSDFVHKNIRPETILTLESAASATPIPYLLGFEKFRLATSETFKTGDTHWVSNLYRHPKRQGLWPEEEYTMLHDIYSLGIVLLEIGLWTNFVTYLEPRSAIENSHGTMIENSHSVEIVSGVVTDKSGLGPMLTDLVPAHTTIRSSELALRTKNLLVELAHNKLPDLMGDKYAHIAVRCLTCLDTDDPGLGDLDKFLDKDDIVVGVEFIESVIMGLNEISC